jgi:GDP-D-mannose 3',5'-epimerase
LLDREPNRSGSLAQEEAFCDEFHLVDLRVYDNCKKVVKGCDHVFNLAADMGGGSVCCP